MSFYEQIAKYYDLIFPINKKTVDFIKSSVGLSPKRLLDIACGTGGYTLELAKLGYILTGLDLDRGMIAELTQKGKGLNISAIEDNMLNIGRLNANYDGIYCIGNSLSHLKNQTELSYFIKETTKLLKNEGILILQIINYDRILKHKITSLPLIEKDSLIFERKYLIESNDRILFHTILTVGNKRYENTIPLTPIISSILITTLKENGYSDIEIFGDFANSEYGCDSSYSTVIRCKLVADK